MLLLKLKLKKYLNYNLKNKKNQKRNLNKK